MGEGASCRILLSDRNFGGWSKRGNGIVSRKSKSCRQITDGLQVKISATTKIYGIDKIIRITYGNSDCYYHNNLTNETKMQGAYCFAP